MTDRAGSLVEHVLEARELLVAVILDLELHLPGLGSSLLDDLTGPQLGRLDDLLTLDHVADMGPSLLDDLFALGAGVGQEVVTVAEEVSGSAHLCGQRLASPFEQVEEVVPVHLDRRGHGHRPCFGHQGDGVIEQIFDRHILRRRILVVLIALPAVAGVVERMIGDHEA